MSPQFFENPDPDNLDQFGFSVAGVGNKALIGTPFDDTQADASGLAYLFAPEELLGWIESEVTWNESASGQSWLQMTGT